MFWTLACLLLEVKKDNGKEPDMKKPNIIDKRQVRLEDFNKPDYIPFLGGRPNRITVINSDDCINLSILINTTTSVDELLKKLSD